jgi:hypothetical protein
MAPRKKEGQPVELGGVIFEYLCRHGGSLLHRYSGKQ